MEMAAKARTHAAGLLLAATIVLFAFGSSSVTELDAIGQRGRWVALLALAAIAAVGARTVGPTTGPVRWPWWAAALFLGLGTASAAWSVDATLTGGRVATLALLFAAAAALTRGDRTAEDAARAVLRACLAGSAAVAAAGLGLLVVSRHDAILAATTGAGARFRGIGENPNTVPMLLAAALPLAVWATLTTRGRRRLIGLALALLFAGEIGFSGSRGALVAGFGGALCTAVAIMPSRRSKLVVLGLLVVLGVVCGSLDRLPPAAEASPPVAAQPAPTRAAGRGIDAETLFRLQDEIGHPPLGSYRPPVVRTLLGSSGRAQAWQEAVDQAKQRPVVGYGFGTEDHVFVERSYAFQGALVENTYLGLFLQVGVVGLAVFLILLVALAWVGLRAVRAGSTTAAAAEGVLVSAAVLGLTQSGLVSVGNVASITIWTSILALPSLAAEARA